jgi:hypothetical protein
MWQVLGGDGGVCAKPEWWKWVVMIPIMGLVIRCEVMLSCGVFIFKTYFP